MSDEVDFTPEQRRRLIVAERIAHARAPRPHVRAQLARNRSVAASVALLGDRPLCTPAPRGPVDKAAVRKLEVERRGLEPGAEPEGKVLLPGEYIAELRGEPERRATHPLAWLALFLGVLLLAAQLLTQHEDERPNPAVDDLGEAS